ncbi:MAG: ribosome-binding factor A [Holosporales bacterium]|nr:ribosome-binding factor A [Holosporales bacterium]
MSGNSRKKPLSLAVSPISSPAARPKRVASAVQRALADALRKKDLPATVISVQMSACLRQARVYVLPSVGGSAETLLEQLQKQAPSLRCAVGKGVALRYVPELRFFLDDTFARGARIDALLKALPESRNSEDS